MATKSKSKSSRKSSSTKTKGSGVARRVVTDSTGANLPLSNTGGATANKSQVGLGANAAEIGLFADVVSGEHQGRYGVVLEAVKRDSDGIPEKVVLRTRDQDTERLVVNYKDLRVALAGGRR